MGAQDEGAPRLRVHADFVEEQGLAGGGQVEEHGVPARHGVHRRHHLPGIPRPGAVLESRHPDADIASLLPLPAEPCRQQIPVPDLHDGGGVLRARLPALLVQDEVLRDHGVRPSPLRVNGLPLLHLGVAEVMHMLPLAQELELLQEADHEVGDPERVVFRLSRQLHLHLGKMYVLLALQHRRQLVHRAGQRGDRRRRLAAPAAPARAHHRAARRCARGRQQQRCQHEAQHPAPAMAAQHRDHSAVRLLGTR
mmetsp:Transcript_33585/g.85812  ORF Transcript_33585/g.85812 Transcript_33585/m.85812 type:complete len:252 (+) Transcript_33585:850-1605(+)